MEKYLNLRGNSPIVAYEIEPTRIKVYYDNGKDYSYSYDSAGEDNVETMKELAREGSGLTSFITRNVRFYYE